MKLFLTNLLKVAYYDEFLDYLSLDKYKNKSTKDLKEMILKYKESELDEIKNINLEQEENTNYQFYKFKLFHILIKK